MCKGIRREKLKRKLNIKKIVATTLLLTLAFTFLGILVPIPQLYDPPVVETSAIVMQENTQVENVVENTITATPIIEETYTTKYATTGLNIRTEPNTNCKIYKTVSINTALETVDNSEKDGWIEIKIDNSKYYVCSKYLSNEKTKVQTTSRGGLTKKVDASSAEAGDFQGYFTLTYYCACKKCCGKTNGITAWGTKATAGRTIATSSKYAFGTKLVINGHTYVVEDRGGAIQGNKIDVYVDSHSEALKLGVKKNVPVYIGK